MPGQGSHMGKHIVGYGQYCSSPVKGLRAGFDMGEAMAADIDTTPGYRAVALRPIKPAEGGVPHPGNPNTTAVSSYWMPGFRGQLSARWSTGLLGAPFVVGG